MKVVTDETPVAYDKDGEEIPADRLQKWAYNQLAAVPELAAALNEARAQIVYLHRRLGRLDKPHYFTQPTTDTCLKTIDAALAKAGL